MRIIEKRAAYQPSVERYINRKNKTIARALRKIIVPALLAASLNAPAADDLCTVHVAFAFHHQTILKPINSRWWQQNTIIREHYQSSYTTALPCGRTYKLAWSTTDNTQHQNREYHIRTNSKIVIDLGKH